MTATTSRWVVQFILCFVTGFGASADGQAPKMEAPEAFRIATILLSSERFAQDASSEIPDQVSKDFLGIGFQPSDKGLILYYSAADGVVRMARINPNSWALIMIPTNPALLGDSTLAALLTKADAIGVSDDGQATGSYCQKLCMAG